MTRSPQDSVSHLGFWATVLTAAFGLGYILALFASLLKLLPQPWDMILQVAPSLFLAPAFMVMLICMHYAAPADKKVWTAIGVAFAVLYTALVSIAYITQLAVVAPNLLRGTPEQVASLRLDMPGFLQATDALGYAFMSVAALFAAGAFAASNARRALIAHGLVAPIVVLPLFFPWLIYFGLLWVVTFLWMAFSLIIWWRRPRKA